MGIIIRQSIKGTIVNYAGTLIGFFTTFFVLTRFLSTEEIGLARVLIDASILLMSIAQLGSSSAIVRFYPSFKNRTDDNGFFFWTLIVPLFGFLLCGTLFCFFRETVVGFFEEKFPETIIKINPTTNAIQTISIFLLLVYLSSSVFMLKISIVVILYPSYIYIS